MKKNYISPSVEVFRMNPTSILATSVQIDGSGPSIDGGTNNGQDQMGREDNISNPNIWDQNW